MSNKTKNPGSGNEKPQVPLTWGEIIQGLGPGFCLSVNSVPGLDDGLGGGASKDPSHPLCDALSRRVAENMYRVNTSLHYAK